jgi:hypothetical protein
MFKPAFLSAHIKINYMAKGKKNHLSRWAILAVLLAIASFAVYLFVVFSSFAPAPPLKMNLELVDNYCLNGTSNIILMNTYSFKNVIELSQSCTILDSGMADCGDITVIKTQGGNFVNPGFDKDQISPRETATFTDDCGGTGGEIHVTCSYRFVSKTTSDRSPSGSVYC